MTAAKKIDWEVPEKLCHFLDNDFCRYRAAYGGRGSGKSWAAAFGLVKRASCEPIRILCCREYQVSIKDSVKKLLEDLIERLGLRDFFVFTDFEIRGKYSGSTFLFRGLHNNVSEIKSLENIDIAYVEEAESVSAASWDILIPTIRAPKSEIWLVFNPVNETDATYQRFVVNTPGNCRIALVNYWDNPFCPQVLIDEAEACRKNDPDLYAHIWGGQCRRISQASVFFGKYEIAEFDEPEEDTRLFYGLDFGFARDPNALVRCWIEENCLFIDGESGGVGIDLDEMPQMIERVDGASKWQIRADSARPETISFLRRKGFDVVSCEKWKGSVDDGIAFIRSFDRIYIHPRCRKVAEEFALYSYKVDRNSGEIMPIVVDANNHYCDALRYALEPLIKARIGDGKIESAEMPLTY